MMTKKGHFLKKSLIVFFGLLAIAIISTQVIAANFAEYPEAFIDGDTFNGIFVIGSEAKTIDTLSAVILAASVEELPDGGTDGPNGTDGFWRVKTSTNDLEIANNNATPVNGESLRDITFFIDEEDLSTLGDGLWRTNERSYEYQQFLFFDNEANYQQNRIVKYAENDDDETSDYFFIENNKQIARYSLEFTTAARSELDGSTLEDFEETEIELFGEMYSIVQATRPSGQNSVSLILMAGAISSSLNEGETQTYVLNNTDYNVRLTFVDENEVVFSIDGRTTGALEVGETYRLPDGTEIGVTEILYQPYQGGVHSTTFFIGAQKIELRDNDITDSAGSHNVIESEDNIDGTTVVITGNDDNNEVTLNTIEVRMVAEDDYYVPVGSHLSEIIMDSGDDERVLFTQNWDIFYEGLTDETTHSLQLDSSASRRYVLTLFDGNNNEVDIPVAYAEAEFDLTLGQNSVTNARDNQERLILNETEQIFEDDFFVLTGGNAGDGTADSFLVQYQGSDSSTDSSPRIRFEDVGSGDSLEYPISTTGGRVATIRLGGLSFAVFNASSMANDNFQIQVALNGDEDITDAGFVSFVDSYGSEWSLSGVDDAGNAGDPDTWIWTQTTPNSNDYDTQAPSDLALELTAASGPEVRASLSGLDLISPGGDDDVQQGYTSLGTFVSYRSPSGDPQELTLEYPRQQRLPQLFIIGEGNGIPVTTGGNGTANEEVVMVSTVDAVRFDTEIGTIENQNLIVVGGPCVNSVAATLLSVDQSIETCAEGFTPGEARLQFFEHDNGNVALFVAGYSGEDTLMGARFLAGRFGDLNGAQNRATLIGTTYQNAVIEYR